MSHHTQSQATGRSFGLAVAAIVVALTAALALAIASGSVGWVHFDLGQWWRPLLHPPASGFADPHRRVQQAGSSRSAVQPKDAP